MVVRPFIRYLAIALLAWFAAMVLLSSPERAASPPKYAAAS